MVLWLNLWPTESAPQRTGKLQSIIITCGMLWRVPNQPQLKEAENGFASPANSADAHICERDSRQKSENFDDSAVKNVALAIRNSNEWCPSGFECDHGHAHWRHLYHPLMSLRPFAFPLRTNIAHGEIKNSDLCHMSRTQDTEALE